MKAGRLRIWTGVEHPRLLKTIMHIDGLPAVGLVHAYNRPKGRAKNLASYCVAIYPPQYARALGGPVEGERGPEYEKWKFLDPDRVRRFHQALFGMIQNLAKEIPVVSASINTEDRPFAHPYTCDGSFCISPNVAQIMRLNATSLTEGCGFFVSVVPDSWETSA